MKERPIIFSPPMVRAIRDNLKTQTRRIIKPQPEDADLTSAAATWTGKGWVGADFPAKCPYGEVGDRLWVREVFAPDPWSNSDGGYIYRADEANLPVKWKSPIHMPRWASRITLEIVDVRVSRLQDITVEDAIAEGVTDPELGDPREAYRRLWESIHGPGAWYRNDWVWVIEFKRVEG